MASNNLWSGYLAARTSFLTTELNALAAAANAVSTVGGASGVFDNSANLYELADLEFLSGGSIVVPASGGTISIWFLRTLDGGTSFEDGTAGAPGTLSARLPDAIISVTAGTSTKRSGCPGVLLPTDKFKIQALNSCGVAFSATGNIISYRPYTTQQ